MNDNSIRIKNEHGNIVGVGRGATGTYIGSESSSTLAEIQRQLAELRGLLTQYREALNDCDTAYEAMAEAERELESGRPRAEKLRMLLSAIGGAAPGVTAVTAAASAVRDLLSGLS